MDNGVRKNQLALQKDAIPYVRTKSAIAIGSNALKKQIYFKVDQPNNLMVKEDKYVQIKVTVGFFNADNQFVPFEHKLSYMKRSVFREKFGHLTVNDLLDNWEKHFISVAEYLNTKEWENDEDVYTYYGQGADDLEIWTPPAIQPTV
jgi:hypothetical protein